MDNMDSEQIASRQRGIPRLSSRLPRATQSSIPEIHQDEIRKTSHLPRPSGIGSLRIKGTGPLTENSNPTLRSRFGFDQQSLRSRNKSPVRDALQAAGSASLDKTPPGPNDIRAQYISADENNSIHDEIKNDLDLSTKCVPKRKPRPSLTERTLETLSQIPPSPSPSRKRSSTAGTNEIMGPPALSASSMRSSRPNTPSKSRSLSPQKSPFRTLGRSSSPSKEVPPMPGIPDFAKIYTPPRALVKDKGSRIGKPSSVRRSIATSIDERYENPAPPRQIPHGHKVKSMYDLRGAAARSSTNKPSFTSIFKDPPKTPSNNMQLNLAGLERSSGLLKPRSPGENVLAPSPKQTKKLVPTSTVSRDDESVTTTQSSESKPSTKSSLALRQTIAEAKAAKKLAARVSAHPGAFKTGFHSPPIDEIDTAPVSLSGMSLKKRFQNAITTGVLNLAAFGLKQIPEEVLKMYDIDEESHITWSETVDITKLIMADNEVEEISDSIFPDWTDEELANDEGKHSIFRGLQVLDLRGNKLRSLPLGLRRLDQLHTLILSNNILTNDTFDIICEIPNLQDLQIANNRLEGLVPEKISLLQHLHTLSLCDNRLSEFPSTIEKLVRLQNLDLAGNAISSMPMKILELLPLINLNLSKNKLKGTLCDYKLPQNLRSLNVANNQLSQLCESNSLGSKLQSLILDFNFVEQLPDLSNLKELTTLTISENRLNEMPASFTALSSLRTANFSGNNIKTIDANIARMDDLKTLNLTGNPLRDRKYLDMNVEDLKADLERRLASIEDYEDRTQQSVITSSHEKVAHSKIASETSEYLYSPVSGILDLSSLSLTDVNPAQVDLTQPINTIRLSNNNLTCLPEALLSHHSIKYTLKSLDISHNQSLHPTTYLSSPLSLPVLKSLYIVSTGLTSLDQLTEFLSAPSLKELNISCHRLTGHIPWVKAYFPSLTTLLATDNWFTSIDVEAVRGLEVIDIRNNEIESLPPKIGELGNYNSDKIESGRLRSFEVSGNKFRVPRLSVIEKGTEAILRDLRRMVPTECIGDDWKEL